MKLTTLIIEDSKLQYNRIKEQLSGYRDIIIVGTYLGEQPFDLAVKAINKLRPNLIIIDWNLDDLKKRTGEQIIAQVDKYPYYILFCSSYINAINKTQSIFSNAKFFLKEPSLLFFPPKELEIALKIAKEYLKDESKISFKYYRNGKRGYGKENISDGEFFCKDIICLHANGHQYYFECLEKNKIEHYAGFCEKSSDLYKIIEEINYSNFLIVSINPFAILNTAYYEPQPDSKIYRIKPRYISSLNPSFKIK